MSFNKRAAFTIVGVVAAVLGIVTGVLIGYFSHSERLASLTQDGDSTVIQRLIKEIKAENIKENLRYLTTKTQLAGTPADFEQADYMRRTWLDQGLDSAKLTPYEVLLSYPGNKTSPNKAQITNEDGTVDFTSQLFEKILTPVQDQNDVVPPFNAYSPAGNIKGDLVYVNYGLTVDFDRLSQMGVNVTGKIAIARYGRNFRGNKVEEAWKAGAIGLLLYSDPKDYVMDGVTKVYPDSWWLPGTGVQRGNVVLNKGDQLTPGYPANEYGYRMTDEDLKKRLPQIPVHPIGYDDAWQFLRRLGGKKAPSEWQGSLNITYHIGPGFKYPYDKQKVKVDSYNTNQRKTTYNVIGTIKGSVEPDRYVIVGNHRDAWVFGAVDPSSGTAVMLELTRTFGKLLSEGWRPRRTILFCSWGAEEYGLVGSTEWVEDMAKTLQHNAVAYINCDIAVRGNYSFRGRSSPLLRPALIKATKQVPDPRNCKDYLYNSWKKLFPSGSSENDEPSVPILGSGSDFAPFIQQVGVTVSDITYDYDPGFNVRSYPMYHSVYETFDLVDWFIDPEFVFHQATTRVWAELARSLADSLLLPLSAQTYASSLSTYATDARKGYGSKLQSMGISLDGLDSAVENFTKAADEFHDLLNTMDKQNPLAVRMWNDRIMLLERAFIDPTGLPERPLYRHLIFAPSSKNSYAGASFPGLSDLMYDYDNAPPNRKEEVKKHISVLTYTIQSAANTLK